MDNRKVIWSPLAGTSQELAMVCPAATILYHGTRGGGKDLKLNTPILTVNGWKQAGCITYNDKLIGDDGYPCDIDGIFPIHGNKMYAIEFSNGTIIEAGLEHRWKASYDNLDWDVFTTKDLLNNIGIYVPIFKNPILKNHKWEFEKNSIAVVSVTPTIITDSVCFSVNNESHCFVIKDFIISHNTDVQIMRFRASVGIGYGRYFRGIITDLTYHALDDIVNKTKKYFSQFNDGAKFLSSKGDYRWVWKTGEELLLRSVSSEEDYYALHGQEFAYIGVNEVSKLPSLEIIDLLSSLNRTSFVPEEHPLPDGTILPKIPMCMFLTTNPSGTSRNELKKRFIDKAAPGEIFKTEVTLFNPRTQQEEIVTKTQCHIFSSWMENSKLAVEYIADLNAISDPVKRKQWLLGDWGAADDNETMFGDIWDYSAHVVKPFDIPSTWQITRSYDWGSSAPFSVGFWAISDGSDVELRDGATMSTIRGDVFRIAEWYGAQAGSPNKGLFMISAEISKGIIERQMSLNIHDRIKPGPADNSIWDIKSGASIASEMQKPVRLDNGQTVQGITWIRSDKSPGSRVHGWEMMRKMLEDAKRPLNSVREKPGMFIFNTCTDFIEQIPILMRDSKKPDDVDSSKMDHIADECRYFVLSTATGARSGKTVGLG